MATQGSTSEWRWVLAIGCLGLGCDSLLPASEPEVVAKTQTEPEAKTEPEVKTKPEVKADTNGAPAPTPAAPIEAKAPADPAPPGQPSAPPEPGVAAEPSAPVEPSALPEPTPAAPVEPVPAPLAAFPTAAPTAAALSDKMQRRLRSALRQRHDARTLLPAVLAVPEPDGGVSVLALYEYSEYEACVGQSDGSQEARRDCANARINDAEQPSPGLRKCTVRGLVRAHYGPSAKSQPEYGGALEVQATHTFTGGCTVTTVRHFGLADVDGDGQPELAVDVLSRTPETTYRDSTPYDVFTRTVGWYRADLQPQYESDLTSWHNGALEMGEPATSRRIRLEDTDGDGRSDLVIDEIDYETDGSCTFDDVGWLKVDLVDPEGGCAGEVSTTVRRYDQAKDAWVEGS